MGGNRAQKFNYELGGQQKGVTALHMQNAKKKTIFACRLCIKLGPSNLAKKANLWLHLARWNLPDFLLCLESKTKPYVTKVKYIWGGTLHRKIV